MKEEIWVELEPHVCKLRQLFTTCVYMSMIYGNWNIINQQIFENFPCWCDDDDKVVALRVIRLSRIVVWTLIISKFPTHLFLWKLGCGKELEIEIYKIENMRIENMRKQENAWKRKHLIGRKKFDTCLLYGKMFSKEKMSKVYGSFLFKPLIALHNTCTLK